MHRSEHFVLLADDSENDQFFLKHAINTVSTRLRVVGELHTGEQVMAYLSGRGRYQDRREYPFPDLLIMDMRMPRTSGLQVLEWLRAQPFSGLKVAILADSSSPADEARARGLGADHFFSKLVSPREMINVVMTLEQTLDGGRSR